MGFGQSGFKKSSVKQWALSGLAFIFSVSLPGEKLANLPQVNHSNGLGIIGNRLFISDTNLSTVHSYSLDDYGYIKSIGKKGEGPGEFIGGPKLELLQNQLTVSSIGKVSIFSLNGELQFERKGSRMASEFKIIGDNFLTITVEPPRVLKKGRVVSYAVTLFNNKMEEVRDIVNWQMTLSDRPQPGKMAYEPIRSSPKYQLYNDKIIFADPRRGIHIETYDLDGNRLKVFDLPYQKVAISKAEKEWQIQYTKDLYGSSWKRMAEVYNGFKFPDYYPAFYGFRIADEKIYIFTHQVRDNRRLYHVLDLEGKLKKNVTLPATLLFYISSNRFYYLEESIENETWELHAEAING